LKKHIIPILSAVIAVVFSFLSGLFFGRKIANPPVQLSAVISEGPVAVTSPTRAEETVPLQINYPIDMNTASLEEIMTLPGIGEVLAQRIIDYRTSHGAFSSPEELMNVSGISEKRYENIKDYINVGG